LQVTTGAVEAAPAANAAGPDWIAICKPDDIWRNTGVCALVGQQQVAVFNVGLADGQTQYYAIGNYDPNSQAAVLSRGIVGNLGERTVVASPLYKQHFDLATGECLEAPENSVAAYPVKLADGMVWVAA
jgi:nitrite reductase (NADH) small subunit